MVKIAVIGCGLMGIKIAGISRIYILPFFPLASIVYHNSLIVLHLQRKKFNLLEFLKQIPIGRRIRNCRL